MAELSWSKNYVKNLLERDYGTGKLLSTTELSRRIGKTTALIELAAEKDIPILVKSASMADHIRRTSDNMGLHIDVYVYNINLHGRKFTGVLIEEGFASSEIWAIAQHWKIMGGYNYFPHNTEFDPKTKFIEPVATVTEKPKKKPKIQIILDNGEVHEKILSEIEYPSIRMRDIVEKGYQVLDDKKEIKVWYPPHRITKVKYIPGD